VPKKTVILPWRHFAVICFLVMGASENPSPAQTQVTQSSPFHYSGFTSPQWKNYAKESLFVPMADGVKLAVDIFLPSEGPNGGPFPVAFSYTPYGRASIDLKTGKIYDSAATPLGRLLLSRGYALVTADMRGSGASYGTQMPFSPVLGKDGKALVDWIASQKWSDGNVGMHGQSYLGSRLPWHGYRRSQKTDGGLNETAPVKLRFDLIPTSWVFKKGHRVRVVIAGADYPNFSLNPGLAPHGKPEECPRTRITIHRTGKYASRIELPVIPGQ